MYSDHFRAVLELAHHGQHPAPAKITNPVARVLPSVPDHAAGAILAILLIILVVAWVVAGVRRALRRHSSRIVCEADGVSAYETAAGAYEPPRPSRW